MAVTRAVAGAALTGHPSEGSGVRVVLHDFIDRWVPRFAYDRGTLEFVHPTPKHENDDLASSLVVTTVAEELGIDHRPLGATTYGRLAFQHGFETDLSFDLLDERFTRDLQDIDPPVDPPPDLVSEVEVTHPSPEKRGRYASFGVPEIWWVRGDRVGRLVPGSASYRETAESYVPPPPTPDVLTRFVLRSRDLRRLDWVREVRAWARESNPTGGDASG